MLNFLHDFESCDLLVCVSICSTTINYMFVCLFVCFLFCSWGSPFSCGPHFVKTLSTMIHLSLVALRGMAQSYTMLWSICSFWLAFYDCVFCSGDWGIIVIVSSVCPLMRIRGLCKLLCGREWLWGKLNLALVNRAILSKYLVELSADGWSSAPSPWDVLPEATQF